MKRVYMESSEGVPAQVEHERFMQAYYKACSSSRPEDWFNACMIAKQWECKVRESTLDIAKQTR